MIITRAPLRLSFAGGGTDIPAFYRPYGPGIVVSTSISRYVYVTLNRKFGGGVSVRYRIHENVDRAQDVRHPLIRECLLAYGVHTGVEIVIASEVPARGSGLGASSALAVALCLALDHFNRFPNYHEGAINWRHGLAENAARIEIERCGSPIGKQDHYASAVGGLNRLQFNDDDSVGVVGHPRDEFTDELEGQSMLFYLDIEHAYEGGAKPDGNFVQRILKDQVAEVAEKRRIHELQRDNAQALWEHMTGYAVMERFQDHVNENWRLKRTVHGEISNPAIDAVVEKAYAAGAVAAKVCGAGGGGFLYLVVPPAMQDDVRAALGLHELSFRFDTKGAMCIFNEQDHHENPVR